MSDIEIQKILDEMRPILENFSSIVTLGATEKVELLFREFAQMSPQSSRTQCYYGMLLDRMGRHHEASMAYQYAIKLDPIFNNTSCEVGKKKLVVLLHNNNDLDHIAPVIYKWSKVDAGPIIVLWAPDSLGHKNAEFLLHFIGNLKGVQLYMPDPVILSVLNWLNGLRVEGTLSREPETYGLAHALFDALLPPNQEGVFVTDHYIVPLTFELCAAAHHRNVKCVGLPHGESVVTNRKYSAKDYTLSLEVLDLDENRKAFGVFDSIVVPSRVNFDILSFVPEKKKSILGSARNSDEWLEVLSSIVPELKLEDSEGKLKIVIFMPSSGYSIYMDELVRSIRMLTRFPDVAIAVKMHPREADFGALFPFQDKIEEMSPSSWIKYIGNDVYTPRLLEWGDVFISIGTGAVFHPLKRSKPVLELSYAMGFVTALARGLPCTDIRDRDRLIQLIWQFKELSAADRGAAFYDKIEVASFLKEFTEGPGGPVLDVYIKHLSSLCNHVDQPVPANWATEGAARNPPSHL